MAMTHVARAGIRAERGCGHWIGIGCLALVVLGMSAVGVIVAFDRLWMSPGALPEVEVRGQCPHDEVVVFLETSEERFETMSAGLEELNADASGDTSAAVEAVDVAALRANLDEAAEMEVPPCARQTLAAEIELETFMIDTVEEMWNCRWPRSLCAIGALWTLARGVAPRVDRLHRAREALAAKAMIYVP